ncbi:hypothetical protein D3C81_2332210 [compost metagenome]
MLSRISFSIRKVTKGLRCALAWFRKRSESGSLRREEAARLVARPLLGLEVMY